MLAAEKTSVVYHVDPYIRANTKDAGDRYMEAQQAAIIESNSLSFPAYIDSSILSTYRACKRKHFYSTLSSLYPMGQSVHLIAGGALARGLEAARKLCFASETPPSLEEMLVAALPPFAAHWGDYTPPEVSAKTFENTFNALAHYLQEYHPSHDNLQPYRRPDGSPAVEYTFAIPLEGLNHPISGEPILFSGRFDMVGILPGDIVCVVDEKTTSSLGFDWASKWDLRGQFLGYIWALRQHGIDCSHACINGIAILKTKNEVRRAIVKYPTFMLARWETLMRNNIREMINLWKLYTEGVWSKDFTYPYNFADSCDSYGGCAFKQLCCAHDPEPFTSNYIKYRYNPLDLNPIEEERS